MALEYGESGSVNLIDNVDPVSDNDMALLQRQCPSLNFLIDYLENRTLPNDEKKQRMCIKAEQQFVMKDGLLYHYYQPNFKGKLDPTGYYVFQLVLPKSKINDILYHYHDSLAGGGHFGITRTFFKIRQKYWFPRMHQEIKSYVSSCQTCQKTKTDRRQQPPPLNPLPVEDPWSRIHIDILGPLPKTQKGYQYILLIIDSFSKWSEAFPLVSQSAQEVANILYNEVICRYGAPRSILSDRGRNFMSKLVSALCELFEIKRYFTSSYHPQTNATVERANSTLAKTLAAYVDENQTNWPNLLPSIMMAFRSTPATESTGFSPYQLVFGKEMILPVDVGLLPKPSLPAQTKQFVDDLLNQLQIARDIAKKNMEFAKEKSKIRFDKKAKTPDFQVNDKVYLRQNAVKPGLSHKLSPKWVGPYTITKIGPNYTYKIKNCETNKLHKALVNATRLKHFQENIGLDLANQEQTETVNDPQTDSNDRTLVHSDQERSDQGAQSDANPQSVEANGP